MAALGEAKNEQPKTTTRVDADARWTAAGDVAGRSHAATAPSAFKTAPCVI